MGSVTRPATAPVPVSWPRASPAPLDSSVPSSTHVTLRDRPDRRLRARRPPGRARSRTHRPSPLAARRTTARCPSWSAFRRGGRAGGGRGREEGRVEEAERRRAAVATATHSPGCRRRRRAGARARRGAPGRSGRCWRGRGRAGSGNGRGRVASVRRRRRRRRGGFVELRRRVGALGVGARRASADASERAGARASGGAGVRWTLRAPPRAPPRARARGRGTSAPSASWVWSFRWWARCHAGPRIPPPTKATSWTAAAGPRALTARV